MSDRHAPPNLKQHLTNLETILTGSSSLPQPHQPSNASSTAPPQKKKPRPQLSSIISQRKSPLATHKALELSAASHHASLTTLLDASIEQTEALLTWPKAERSGQPSAFDTAFRDLYELKEEQRQRLEEYGRRARVLKMKLEVAKIAVGAVGREVRGLRGVVEEGVGLGGEEGFVKMGGVKPDAR